jgi:hypothetical protein
MAFPRIFRVFYSLTFTILYLILLFFIVITPADAIRQAIKTGQSYYAYVIAGCYFLTLFLVLMIYGSRLFHNRTVLAAIPKSWIPIGKGDVNRKVRLMIAESLSRSAIIAWHSRPRLPAPCPARNAEPLENDTGLEEETKKDNIFERILHKTRTIVDRDDEKFHIPPHPPPWGTITHPGWSSPLAHTLPNLHYLTVILELPPLIEAKAVSLAPPDPSFSTSSALPPMPEPRALDLLQRPVAMGLREYILYLASLGVIPQEEMELAMAFVARWEEARFAGRPRTEAEFGELMHLFAQVLRSMKQLESSILDDMDDHDEEDDEFAGKDEDESDIDDDASSTTMSERLAEQPVDPSEPNAAESLHSSSSASSSIVAHAKSVPLPPSPPKGTNTYRSASYHSQRSYSHKSHSPVTHRTHSSTSAAAMVTAPTTPRKSPQKGRGRSMPRDLQMSRLRQTPSHNSADGFARTRAPAPVEVGGDSDSLSGRSWDMQQSERSTSLRSGSSGSVIRLRRASDAEDGHEQPLPYVLRVFSNTT